MRRIHKSIKKSYFSIVSWFVYKRWWRLVAIQLIAIGVLGFVFAEDAINQLINHKVNRELNNIERDFDSVAKDWLYDIELESRNDIWDHYTMHNEESEWRGALLLYEDSTCVYWNRAILCETSNILGLEDGMQVHASDDYVLISKTERHGNKTAVMLFMLTHYEYNNHSHIYEDNDDVNLVDYDYFAIDMNSLNGYKVKDINGEGLFSVKYKVRSDSLFFFKFSFWMGLLTLVLGSGFLLIVRYPNKLPFILLGVAIMIITLRVIMQFIDLFPTESGLVDMGYVINKKVVEMFGYENTIGILFLDTMTILLFVIFSLRIKYYLKSWMKSSSKTQNIFAITIYTIMVTLITGYLLYLFLVVVKTATINLNHLSITGITFQDFFSYSIIPVGIASIFMINVLEKRIFTHKQRKTLIPLEIIAMTINLIIFREYFSTGLIAIIIVVISFAVLEIIFSNRNKRGYLYLIFTIILSAVITISLISQNHTEREKQVVNIANAILVDSINFNTVYGFMALTPEEKKVVSSDISYVKLKNDSVLEHSGDILCGVDFNALSVEEFIKDGDYTHYKIVGHDQFVVVSYTNKLNTQPLLLFVFVFVFIQLSLFLLLGVWFFFPDIHFYGESIHVKLKVVITSVCLFMTITIYVFVNNYLNQSQDKYDGAKLSSKIQSIIVDLELKGSVNVRTKEFNDYIETLQKLHFVNITVFDERGEFITTSDPIALEKSIISTYIDPNHYLRLLINHNFFTESEKDLDDIVYRIGCFKFDNFDEKVLFKIHNIGSFDIGLKNALKIDIINLFIIANMILLTLLVVFYRYTMHPLIKLKNSLSRMKYYKRIDSSMYTRGTEVDGLIDLYNNAIMELENTLVKLAESERSDAMKMLTRQIAHELRNPITPIKLKAQMILLRKQNGDSDWDQNIEDELNVIISQIDLLSNTINQLYTSTNEKIGVVDTININKTMRDVRELYSGYTNITITYMNNTLNKNISIRMSLDNLWSVLTNVMINAISAIGDKNDGCINMELNLKDDMVVLSIKDNGSGISDEIKDYIFMPNFTTKKSGSGIGLILASGFVKNAGGVIYFESEYGTGTTFYVEVPYTV